MTDLQRALAKDREYLLLIGYRAGLDSIESVQDRAAASLFEAKIERQEAFIDRRIAARSLAVARRVYVASIIVFASALAVFVAALAVGAR